MYLSHPVRRMRENPQEGAVVTLIVETTDGDDRTISTVIDAVESVGGTVEKERPFGSLEISIYQEDIADLCSVEGVSALQTDNTIGFTGDAGEDV